MIRVYNWRGGLISEDAYSPLWGCTGDGLQMVVRCIMALLNWGRIFNMAANSSPKTVPQCTLTTISTRSLSQHRSGEWAAVYSVSRHWTVQIFRSRGKRANCPSLKPLMNVTSAFVNCTLHRINTELSDISVEGFISKFLHIWQTILFSGFPITCLCRVFIPFSHWIDRPRLFTSWSSCILGQYS